MTLQASRIDAQIDVKKQELSQREGELKIVEENP
jgi:hypothetical protein